MITNANEPRIVDHLTGECFFSIEQFKHSNKNVPIHKPKGYVGIDSKWLPECKDEIDLIETLKNIDAYLTPKAKVMVDNAYLLDCVASGQLSAKGTASILALSKTCVGWNYGFTTKVKLLEIAGVTPKHFARWCKEMQPYLTVERLFNNSDEMKITFNPLIVWKGCTTIRQAKIMENYSKSSSPQIMGS